MSENHKICSKIIMDTIGNSHIKFDNNGICQYIR